MPPILVAIGYQKEGDDMDECGSFGWMFYVGFGIERYVCGAIGTINSTKIVIPIQLNLWCILCGD